MKHPFGQVFPDSLLRYEAMAGKQELTSMEKIDRRNAKRFGGLYFLLPYTYTHTLYFPQLVFPRGNLRFNFFDKINNY